MTNQEMIRKYRLELVSGGIQAHGKLTEKAIAELKAAKPELLEILKKAEQDKIALKAEAAAKKKQEIARQKPLRKLALVISGHYLMDCNIQYVVPLTAEDKTKYCADFAKNTLYHTAWETETITVQNPAKNESETIKKIQGKKADGYLSYGESVVWLISEDEKQLILTDIKKEKEISDGIKVAKKEKKQAQLSALQAEAERTGLPVVINSYITDQCTRNSEDCSFDQATVYIRADGSTYTTYVCCH